jgi:membrane protein implicated in regulation of membrane protease activity
MIRPGPLEVGLLLSVILIGGVVVFAIWLVKRATRQSSKDELKKYHQELHEQAKTITEDKD